MASGQGLICCRNTKANSAREEQIKIAHAKHLALIKGKYELRGEWVNMKTPTLHYCIKHDEEHKIRPSIISHNKCGMPCCGREKTLELANKKHQKAKTYYDERLAAIGRAKRIDEYTGSSDKIKHLCLIHNEIHAAMPQNLLKGQGLYCCWRERTGQDNIESAITGKLKVPMKPEWLYLYRLKRFPEYLKIGIAVDINPKPDPNNPKILRSFDDEYGDQVAMWFFDNRIDAFLVEQAILQSTISSSDIPEGLDENWAGSREVRLLPEKELIDFMQNLVEEHHKKGRWQFVLDNIDLTQNQRESVLKKLDKN